MSLPPGRRGALRLIALGVAGWAICGLSMGLGLAWLPLPWALALHAAVSPVAFAALAWINARRGSYLTPLLTATVFIGLALLLDLGLAALVMRDLAMFASPAGTWLPLGLSFLASWLAGALAQRRGVRPLG